MQDNRNHGRKNLTCGPECHAKQRTIRQRERRYRNRLARLEAKAVTQGKKTKPLVKPARSTRHQAKQFKLPLGKIPRGKRTRLQRLAKARWNAAKKRGQRKVAA